ncbi:hypothetical protein BGW42_003626 [Actinomortierella wolfii]|nr:hypothetical protein BGW42_003626 [Actinomortierella wolfii]
MTHLPLYFQGGDLSCYSIGRTVYDKSPIDQHRAEEPSTEYGVSAEVGAKPIDMGVRFTASSSYGLSTTSEIKTALTYSFDLKKDDAGYIVKDVTEPRDSDHIQN